MKILAIERERLGATADSFQVHLDEEAAKVWELYQAGVINRLVEPGSALAEAQALAARLADGPPQSLAGIKALTEAAAHPHLEEQLEREAVSIAGALGGADAHEGIAAFKGKRKPDWPR